MVKFLQLIIYEENNMKKYCKVFAVLTLCLAVVFTFAACGSPNVVGEWVLEKYENVYNNYTEDYLPENKDTTIILNEDGTCSFTQKGKTKNGTWTFDKKLKILLKEDGVTVNILSFEHKKGKLVSVQTNAYGTLTTVFKRK